MPIYRKMRCVYRYRLHEGDTGTYMTFKQTLREAWAHLAKVYGERLASIENGSGDVMTSESVTDSECLDVATFNNRNVTSSECRSGGTFNKRNALAMALASIPRRRPLVCDHCNKEFHGRPRAYNARHHLCSDGCRVSYYAAIQLKKRHAAKVDKACGCCGDAFVPKRSDSRYCSGKCRQMAYRQRLQANDLEVKG